MDSDMFIMTISNFADLYTKKFDILSTYIRTHALRSDNYSKYDADVLIGTLETMTAMANEYYKLSQMYVEEKGWVKKKDEPNDAN